MNKISDRRNRVEVLTSLYYIAPMQIGMLLIATMMWWPAILYAHNCQVLLVLGTGAMTKVLQWHDPVRQENVAAKRLLPAYRDTYKRAAAQDMLQYEWAILHRLEEAQVPGVPRPYDRFLYTQQGYERLAAQDPRHPDQFSEELLSTQNLKHRVDQQLPLYELNHYQDFEKYLHQILSDLLTVTRTMQNVHQNGIIHYDLKPANIMYAKDGRPMVGDFSSAIDLNSPPPANRRQSIRTGGTRPYMAPEFSGEGRIPWNDPKADIYSFGMCLLFAAGEDAQLLTRTLPINFPQHLDRVKTEIHLLISQCTAPLPRDRLQNFSLIEDRLAQILKLLP